MPPRNRLACPQEGEKKSWMPRLIRRRKVRNEETKTVSRMKVILRISSMTQTHSDACLPTLKKAVQQQLYHWSRSPQLPAGLCCCCCHSPHLPVLPGRPNGQKWTPDQCVGLSVSFLKNMN